MNYKEIKYNYRKFFPLDKSIERWQFVRLATKKDMRKPVPKDHLFLNCYEGNFIFKYMREIKQCRSCGSNKIVEVFSLGDQYLSHFVDIKSKKKGKKYPLDVVFCQECYLLQLKHTVDSNLLYGEDYGYLSGTTQTMRDELKDIVYAALNFKQVNKDDVVVDIASNDFSLLKVYPIKGLTKIGFDPITKFEKYNTDSIFINDYFNKEAFIKSGYKKAKIITAISCFYDLDDINTFVADMESILDDDGIIVVQQNYLGAMIQQLGFENVVHEHLEYYSLLSLENLLARYDLEVFHVELDDINGGSFRTYIAKKGKRPVLRTVQQLRDIEKQLNLDLQVTYEEFGHRVRKVIEEIYDMVAGTVKNGKTVYILGASTRGNTLLQSCGLTNRLVKAAMERNPEKFGKKIMSVDIPIISEEQARKDKPDMMLVLPWFFQAEILTREADYLNQGGALMFPLPKPRIISKKQERPEIPPGTLVL